MNPLVPTPLDALWSAVWVAVLAYTVVAFISLIRSPDVTGSRFLLWTALIALLPAIGATAWFVRGCRANRQPAKLEHGRPARMS